MAVFVAVGNIAPLSNAIPSTFAHYALNHTAVALKRTAAATVRGTRPNGHRAL